VERAWTTSGGVPLHLTVVPADRPAGAVVFLHGIASHARIYASLVPGADLFAALAAEGLSVVAPDLRGHGSSGGIRGHLPFRDALADASAAVGHALERFGPPVGLLGSSLGGILALYAAASDPRVAAVVCHNVADLRDVGPLARRARQRATLALARPLRELARRRPWLPVPVTAILAPSDVFEDPDLVRAWRRAPGTVWRYTLASVVSIFLAPEDKPAIEAMDRPLLVATGQEDPIFPVAAQADVVRRVAGPAELWALEGAGHMLPLEHLRLFAPRVGAWLREALRA
jgi:alpha-beta hydrolase superfamily lysophospholipase